MSTVHIHTYGRGNYALKNGSTVISYHKTKTEAESAKRKYIGSMKWGVFKWNRDTHHYIEKNAIKIFKTEDAAERYADKNGGVVRSFY